jgi:TonB family protein
VWNERPVSVRRWRLLLGAAVVGSLFVSRFSAAQTVAGGAIAGVVTDSSSGVGVVGVEVSIDDTSLRTATDERGRFRFAEGSAGARTLRVRRLGFHPVVVVVSAGESARPITIRLAPSTRYLAPVQVRAERTRYTGRLAGYYERVERRTQGTFITRADLEREQPAQLTDMLQRSAGVRVTRGKPGAQSVRMRGRDCRPLVWIDGAPMGAGDVDLDSFSPASLEGIELYLGANNAPGRYQMARGQSECGTVLLWSRGPDTEPRMSEHGVTPGALEALIASLSVYASDDVDVTTSLEAAGAWVVPYPPSMRASGVSGTVVAEFVVDTLGKVESENFGIVSSTHPLFSEAVREAARAAEFRPALRQGRRVRQLVRQPFDFRPVQERP